MFVLLANDLLCPCSPKLSEEERVEDIILRVYNKNPNVYIKIQLGPFIVKLVDELEQQQQSLYQLRSSENVDEL